MAQQPADDGSARRQDDDDDDGINVVAAAAAAAVGPGPAAVAPAGDETAAAAAAARAQMHVDDTLHLEAQMEMQAPQPPPPTTPPVMVPVLDQARNFDDERVDGGLKAWLQVAASFALYFNHLYDPPSSFSLPASLLFAALSPFCPGSMPDKHRRRHDSSMFSPP